MEKFVQTQDIKCWWFVPFGGLDESAGKDVGVVDEAAKSGDEELLRFGGGIEKLTQIKK